MVQGKSIGGSPVSPGIGQDDPSVYFDATESAALHLENNNQDGQGLKKPCLSPVMERAGGDVHKAVTTAKCSKIPVFVAKSPKCSLSDSITNSDDNQNSSARVVSLRKQEELTPAPLPLRRCQTMPDARPRKELVLSNTGSSTEEEQQQLTGM